MEQNTEKTAGKQQEQQVIGKPFVKGQSWNPKGRPKGTISVTSAIKRRLNKIPKGERKKWLEKMVDTIMEEGITNKNDKLLKLLWNYVDGMPKQTLEADLTGTININVVNYKGSSNGNNNTL